MVDQGAATDLSESRGNYSPREGGSPAVSDRHDDMRSFVRELFDRAMIPPA